jgi:hypothetical protein
VSTWRHRRGTSSVDVFLGRGLDVHTVTVLTTCSVVGCCIAIKCRQQEYLNIMAAKFNLVDQPRPAAYPHQLHASTSQRTIQGTFPRSLPVRWRHLRSLACAPRRHTLRATMPRVATKLDELPHSCSTEAVTRQRLSLQRDEHKSNTCADLHISEHLGSSAWGHGRAPILPPSRARRWALSGQW